MSKFDDIGAVLHELIDTVISNPEQKVRLHEAVPADVPLETAIPAPPVPDEPVAG